ncbi:MAG: hypothetical protein EOP49_33745, partial [Sphingobacteriales bacterium]
SVLTPAAQNKTYDGTTTATLTSGGLSGVIAPDAVSVLPGGNFVSANIGNNIPVTAAFVLQGADASNYVLTQPTGLSASILPYAFQAVLSGTAGICPGTSTALQVNVAGYTGTLNLVYSNGTQNFTVNGLTNGGTFTVSPTSNTTYSLVSVTIPNAQVSVSGQAVVTLLPQITAYQDADGDGFGSPYTAQGFCAVVPSGFVTNYSDCDDTDATKWAITTVYYDPDQDGYSDYEVSTCYGIATGVYTTTSLGPDCAPDNENIWRTGDFYYDSDGDGYTSSNTVSICYGAVVQPGFTLTSAGLDCNDNDPNTWRTGQFYSDFDTDGYTSSSQSQVCYGNAIPQGYTSTASAVADCNDSDATINTTFAFYTDADGDSFGSGALVSVCAVNATTPPSGYVLNNMDCNDADALKWQMGTFYTDADFDGYTSGATASVCYGASTPVGYLASVTAIDCNDMLSAVHPGQPDIPYNGIDDNCDGQIDEGNQLLSQVISQQCGTTLQAINSVIQVPSGGSTAIRGTCPGLFYTH